MKSLSQERKNSLIVYSLVLLLSLLSTLFLLPLNFVNIPLLKPGEVSPVDIRSPVSVNAVDEEETERKRERVREKYLPIFSYRKRAYEEVLEKLNSLSYLTPEQKLSLIHI
jgi:membrane-associated HD superfamily phosphohydrolase